MNSLKISIITVCFNSANTIRDTINSVLAQKYPYIEYIIVDGGSTDGTQEIIKSYGERIDKFISEKDRGIYDAMNKGIYLASGDVIGILNSDDVYYNEYTIEKVASALSVNKTDSVFGDLLYVREHDLDKIVRFWKSSVFKPGSFRKGWHPPHPTFFVKKSVYEKYGNFDLNMKVSADFELMLRLLEKHQISTTYIQSVLVKMRVGGESNQSIKNIFLGNQNILKAFKKNDMQVNSFFYLLRRLVPKFKQFILR